MKRSSVVFVICMLMVIAVSGASASSQSVKGSEQPDAICKSKQAVTEAVPWLKLTADLRLRAIYDDRLRLDKKARGHDRFWTRYRARVGATVTPIENLSFNTRLVIEPRLFCRPDTLEDQLIRQEALFDTLNVEWSKILGLPLKVKAGRQDIKMGRGWLIIEGTPRDGTRTFFFDGIRATYDVATIKTTFDVAAFGNHANSSWFIRPFNDRDLDLIEQDETGAFVYATNKSIPDVTATGYFIYKHDDRVLVNGNNSDIYTLGASIDGAIGEHWTYYAEVAPQWGHKNGTNIRALGGTGEIRYHWKDSHDNSVALGYEYRSGDDNPDGSFDILWGRFPHWSNIFNDYVSGLENRVASSPINFHRVSLEWSYSPCEKVEVSTAYHLLFADKNPFAGMAGFTDGGGFRGQLGTALLKYKLNEHVSGHLIGEVFGPGNYYDQTRNDVAFFLRYQLMFTW